LHNAIGTHSSYARAGQNLSTKFISDILIQLLAQGWKAAEPKTRREESERDGNLRVQSCRSGFAHQRHSLADVFGNIALGDGMWLVLILNGVNRFISKNHF
jgi:hypothetical protein